ncbi:MAG: DUF1465 family protein [Proteobacteria bacterium]|nr:DUF1465 family protein [Pseudomonadota bacterium]
MSDDQNSEVVRPAETIFFTRTYDEALALVHEARSYLAGPGQQAVKELATETGFDYATESLRLTTRLTEAMSWLLFQRALQEGEITEEEAQADDCRLQYFDVCLPEEEGADLEGLPADLLSLLERSELLYRRIVRLDNQSREAYKRLHS